MADRLVLNWSESEFHGIYLAESDSDDDGEICVGYWMLKI